MSAFRERLPRWWAAVGVTGLGLCVGLLALLPAALAVLKLPWRELLGSYFAAPLILTLNLFPPVLVIWFFYLLTGRGWIGFLCTFLPWVGLSVANYHKIRLRGDPLQGGDLLLLAEARGIAGRYTMEVSNLTWAVLFALAGGLLFSILLLPRLEKRWRARIAGSLGCLALMTGAYFGLYTNEAVYQYAVNDALINPWSEPEVFVSKGFVYPFIYSLKDMDTNPPRGYDKKSAREILKRYHGADIPQERKVDVVGIMLEAFCDLTDFPSLGDRVQVRAVYEPLHQLKAESVSGNLLTNIFAGGTVDSEWCFLTGYSRYDAFRVPTDSWVWYLRDQGYDAVFHHPGYSWFYNRQNVNEYLGFQESLFTENCFGVLANPEWAFWRSDKELADHLLGELEERDGRGSPYFSFSVSYQGHGPYDDQISSEVFLTPEDTDWSEESCNILNNYLSSVSDTIGNLLRLKEGLEALERPTVLVFFGDHKPWLGNGESVYRELEANLDLGTLEGFSNYYSTPYFIWANTAAKELLGEDFTGWGGNLSPCFLMTKLFDLCAWEGPCFMQLSREMRDFTPLVHVQERFLVDGVLTGRLDGAAGELYRDYLCAQYYRQHEVRPPA